jgi:hypoxanthine phosphoribosyltransferase
MFVWFLSMTPDAFFHPEPTDFQSDITSEAIDEGHLYVSWEEYHLLIERLAALIYQSYWQFDQIICLAKGGLRIGDILARLYRFPLGVLAATSYGGKDNQVRGSLTFAPTLTMTSREMGQRVLLVDDLADSGMTLKSGTLWLQSHYPQQIVEVKTAVLWYKACSVVTPDYFVEYLPHNPWIHQPFEVYEQLDLAELAQRFPS